MPVYQTPYELIKTEEESFKLPVPIAEKYEWSMYDHILTATLYKNSIFKSGKDENKPFKNIIRPLLNLQYRAEGFDVKDIELYVNDEKNYYKSFLIKKYHDEKWAYENKIDTFIDNVVESWVDYGGAIVKKVKGTTPEVVPLRRLAFCDQTSILSGPICEKHNYSPDELQEMGSKWENVDEVISLAQDYKKVSSTGQPTPTPGKYIEVYELHGSFPRYWLYDTTENGYGGYWYDEDAPEMELVRQVHICTFYTSKDGQKQGITLYKALESKSPYRVILRDEIFGRALGLGGVEELEQSQVWTNYNEIRKRDMLDSASKTLLQTPDTTVSARHPAGLAGMENLEIIETAPNMPITQIDTFPRNLALFDKSTNEWEAHAQQMSGATEALLGENPSSGTPFKLQELVVQQGEGLHEYRKGKLATFIGELYQDWFIPAMVQELTSGDKFLTELSLEELQDVSEKIVTNYVNQVIVENILQGNVLERPEIDALKQKSHDEFMKSGNRRFIEIFKGEMKDADVNVHVNVAGKQKNLAQQVDKLVNIFRTISANPAILQSPPMAKLFNEILESSGLSPLDFTGFTAPQPVANQPALAPGQPANPSLSPI